ncbi:MAG: hypothetical protein WC745_02595 [Patescibacteria group bacterium]
MKKDKAYTYFVGNPGLPKAVKGECLFCQSGDRTQNVNEAKTGQTVQT